jgi:hypothetical protein
MAIVAFARQRCAKIEAKSKLIRKRSQCVGAFASQKRIDAPFTSTIGSDEQKNETQQHSRLAVISGLARTLAGNDQ